MKRIVKFGPQYGKPKGPRMPSMKPRASKVPGGSMAKMKYVDGGSINEAMRPRTPPDPAVEASIKNAPAEAERKRREMVAKNAADRAERAAAMKKPPVKKNVGGSISSASKRADGCATKGKTKGRFI